MSISLSTVKNQFGVSKFSQAYSGGGYFPKYAYYVDQNNNDQAVPSSGTISLSQMNSVFNNSGSQTFASYGTHYWICPPGITQVEVYYPDPASSTGTTGVVASVTPGVTYDVFIGALGEASYFGSYRVQSGWSWFHWTTTEYLVSAPAYLTKVLHWDGSVDAYLHLYFSISSNGGGSPTYTGYAENAYAYGPGHVTSEAANVGLQLTADQGYHPADASNIVMTPVTKTSLIYYWAVDTHNYTSSRGNDSGRANYSLSGPYPDDWGIGTWAVNVTQSDPWADDGSYSFDIYVAQTCGLQLVWHA
jgi:hypothetical protein